MQKCKKALLERLYSESAFIIMIYINISNISTPDHSSPQKKSLPTGASVSFRFRERILSAICFRG